MANKIGAIELRRMAGFYTAKEAADELGMSRWTFYNQLRFGAVATSDHSTHKRAALLLYEERGGGTAEASQARIEKARWGRALAFTKMVSKIVA